jgi:hypothetical protein
MIELCKTPSRATCIENRAFRNPFPRGKVTQKRLAVSSDGVDSIGAQLQPQGRIRCL